MYSSFNHTLEVMKNATHIEKYLVFATVILTFVKKKKKRRGYFILHNDTTRILFLFFQMGCFIGPQNQRFRMKKGCVIFRPQIRENGVLFKRGYGHGIRFGLLGNKDML